jgi:hypothetical protein
MEGKLKKIVVSLFLMFSPTIAEASTRVRGYTRRNGTNVQTHRRTSPNSTRRDNWSTQGNVNPYTGRPGTRKP